MSYLVLQESDRKAILLVLERTLITITQLESFVQRAPVGDEVRREINTGDSIRTAVTSLFMHSLAKNKLQTVLRALSEGNEDRHDIKQLILTLSTRPGWNTKNDWIPPKYPSVESEIGEDFFEGLKHDGDPFIDPDSVEGCMKVARQRVCFLRTRDKTHLGTGFLIHENQIMTCCHVVKDNVIGNFDASAKKLCVRDIEAVFDYSVSNGKGPVDPDTLEGIAVSESADCQFAPFSRVAAGSDPEPHELDFVILTLCKNADSSRGYYKLEEFAEPPGKYDPIIVAQHPGDLSASPTKLQPLKVTFATPGVDGENANKTRLLYYNATLPGSSGSPVFNRDGRLIAIHSGRGEFADPDRKRVKDNRGVPMRNIVEVLRKRGSSRRAVVDSGWQSAVAPTYPIEGVPEDNEIPARFHAWLNSLKWYAAAGCILFLAVWAGWKIMPKDGIAQNTHQVPPVNDKPKTTVEPPIQPVVPVKRPFQVSNISAQVCFRFADEEKFERRESELFAHKTDTEVGKAIRKMTFKLVNPKCIRILDDGDFKGKPEILFSDGCGKKVMREMAVEPEGEASVYLWYDPAKQSGEEFICFVTARYECRIIVGNIDELNAELLKIHYSENNELETGKHTIERPVVIELNKINGVDVSGTLLNCDVGCETVIKRMPEVYAKYDSKNQRVEWIERKIIRNIE